MIFPKKLTTISILSIVAIFLIFFGFNLTTKNRELKTKTEKGWSTYTNPKAKLTLQYPSDFKLTQEKWITPDKPYYFQLTFENSSKETFTFGSTPTGFEDDHTREDVPIKNITTKTPEILILKRAVTFTDEKTGNLHVIATSSPTGNRDSGFWFVTSYFPQTNMSNKIELYDKILESISIQ